MRPTPPLADAELYPLLRFFLPEHPQGRRVAELRSRLDAVFWLSGTALPWRALPARFGKPDTVSRWFRRITHRGVWHRLLHALADAGPHDALAGLRLRILRACRRADRLVGAGFQRLIRKLGLWEALPGPPWMLRDPLLAHALLRLPLLAMALDAGAPRRPTPLALVVRALRRCAPRSSPPRDLRLAWC